MQMLVRVAPPKTRPKEPQHILKEPSVPVPSDEVSKLEKVTNILPGPFLLL